MTTLIPECSIPGFQYLSFESSPLFIPRQIWKDRIHWEIDVPFKFLEDYYKKWGKDSLMLEK